MKTPISTVVIDQDYVQIPKSEYEQLLSNYQNLELQLAELKRLIFGSKSERFVPNTDALQLGLFVEEVSKQKEIAQQQVSYNRSKTKKLPVRLPLAPHLPRIEEIIEPQDI